MSVIRARAPVITLSLALAAAGQPIAGVVAGPETGEAFPEEKAGDISEKHLETVAEAYVTIGEIRESHRDTLGAAGDPASAHAIQEEINREMAEAVEDHGLDIRTYNEVVMAAQANDTLRDRLSTKIREAAEDR